MIKRLATIRATTTAVATIVVAIALVLGAAGLIAALRRTMVDEVAEAARAQASDVVRQLEAGRPPILEVAGADEQLIQVMTPAGAVVAASPNMAGRPAVVRIAPGQSAQSSLRSTTTSSPRWPRARRRLTVSESFWWPGRWSMFSTPPQSSPG